MKRYIDADTLIKEIKEYQVSPEQAVSETEDYINGYNSGLHTAICAVIDAPIVDVIEAEKNGKR